jgi:hypothetical protein
MVTYKLICGDLALANCAVYFASLVLRCKSFTNRLLVASPLLATSNGFAAPFIVAQAGVLGIVRPYSLIVAEIVTLLFSSFCERARRRALRGRSPSTVP